jgi:hypothetical protein
MYLRSRFCSRPQSIEEDDETEDKMEFVFFLQVFSKFFTEFLPPEAGGVL